MLDKDNDGYLDSQEFTEGMKNLSHAVRKDEDWQKIFDVIDSNSDGKIDFKEWIAAVQNKKELLSSKNTKQMFRFIDSNNSGTISTKELLAFF